MNNNDFLKIIFAGTPSFSAIHLKYLIKHLKYKVVGVLTKKDKPSGRNKIITFSAVKKISLKNNIAVHQPVSLKQKEVIEFIKNYKIDLIVVVAYGLIFTEEILKIPRLGCINIHPSLLPRWRGPSPIQYAILSGDNKTGVTVIKMNKKIDSGDIILQHSCKIDLYDTSQTLFYKLSKISIKLMIKAIKKISNNSITLKKQNIKRIKYSKKLNSKKAKLNWYLTAKELECMIRAFIPWPVSYFYIKNNLIKVWKAHILYKNFINSKPGEIIIANKNGIQIATKKNIINITELQLSGKRVMTAKDFLNSKKSWFISGDIIV